MDAESATGSYGKFIVEPFERGFGATIGNGLRRVLLSSIEGAAITAVKIEGVLHEFSSIPGVKQDTTDMILNLGHEDDELPSGQRRMLDLFMMSGRPTPPTDYKLGVDRDALGRSLEPMQSWHFERIVVAHGRLVEHDAREIFRDAFAFTI